jgi:hypothetical protein
MEKEFSSKFAHLQLSKTQAVCVCYSSQCPLHFNKVLIDVIEVFMLYRR